MKILAWTLSYWDNEQHSHRWDGQWYGLPAWKARVGQYLKPFDTFIASGTWSDPKWNPIPGTTVVNAGVPKDSPYEGNKRHYGICAFAAASHYALNRTDWDYCVTLDTDALIGAVDFPYIFTEFAKRKEIMMAPSWYNLDPTGMAYYIGGPFQCWKREGVVRLAHNRKLSDLRDADEPGREWFWERECFYMFRGGRWWNPWPHIKHMGCMVGDPVRERWPFIRKPSPRIVDDFLKHCTSLAVPLP